MGVTEDPVGVRISDVLMLTIERSSSMLSVLCIDCGVPMTVLPSSSA